MDVVGPSGPARAVDPEREVDVHVTNTLGWAKSDTIGLPVGTQVEVPSIDATGEPSTVTLAAPVIQLPVAHGGEPLPLSEQPEIV
jgi:hypothetical protein